MSETANPATALAVATLAGLHNGLGIRLDTDPFRLTVRVGGFEHLFWVSQSELRHDLVSGRDRSQPAERQGPHANVPLYDAARFPPQGAVGCGPWWAVFDRLGQVLLYARGADPVAAFLVRRERGAAWAAGGVFWGDPTLIGGPPTPDAGQKIGRAIHAAGGRP